MNVEGGMSQPLLGDRYRVVKELGHSGFGRTYLAEDLQGAGERCVVQEFLPQIKDKAVLEKAKDIFEREGRVLLQLSHRQVPEYRELIEVPSEPEGSAPRLFLVQDYIPGQSYQDLLNERQRYKGRFNEIELTQLLYQVLPVLTYIHSREIIHRDICPENLVLHQLDGLPVLINFGSVKEIAAKARDSLASNNLATEAPMRIGKVGYAPQEQLSGGEADETSDLYGLAATIMALATGEDPETLNTEQGNWSGFDLLSPKLGNILARMLAVNPSDRFPSAQAVLAALKQDEAPAGETAMRGEARTAGATGRTVAGTTGGAAAVASAAASMYPSTTGAVSAEGSDILVGAEPVMAMASPGLAPIDTPIDMDRGADRMDEIPDTYEPVVTQETKVIGQANWKDALIALAVMSGFVVTALLLWALFRGGRGNVQTASDRTTPNVIEPVSDERLQEGEFLPEETARRAEIAQRRDQLGISEDFFTNLVNQLFYQEYPMLRTGGPNNGPQPVTTASEDEPLRIRWEHIALDLLRKMEGSFNRRSLSELGRYSEADREEWRSQIGAVGIEPRSLYDLVDAKFFNLFPNQAGSDFLTEPTGQLYYALADDQAQMIADGGIRESVTFDPGEFSQDVEGQLNPGEGRLYTVGLSAGQLLRLNLTAPENSTLVSLYPPEPTDERPSIFADSEQATWSGSLSDTGDYELVVINRSNESINYDLAISVDSITDVPVAPPREETTDENSDSSRSETDDSETDDSEDTEASSDDGSVTFERL